MTRHYISLKQFYDVMDVTGKRLTVFNNRVKDGRPGRSSDLKPKHFDLTVGVGCSIGHKPDHQVRPLPNYKLRALLKLKSVHVFSSVSYLMP